MTSPSFLQSLSELVRLLPQIRELVQRQHSIQEAIVTQNDDPTGLRRVRVTREAQGGASESDWIPCGRSTSFTDEPIPEPGTHCLIALVNGDPHRPFFLRTLSNATNPPDTGQLTPTKDNTVRIPGSDRTQIDGDRTTAVKGEQSQVIDGDCFLTVKGEKYQISAEFGQIVLQALAAGSGTIRASADQSIRFEQGGGYAELKGGFWTFGNVDGQTWQMGGGVGGGFWQWDLAGRSVRIINCTGFTINGNEVLVLGSEDIDGRPNVTRGY